MQRLNQEDIVKYCLAFAVLINIVFWFSVRDIRARWDNVPPPPDMSYSKSFGLGDTGFAYRSFGIMIQNLGDTGGRTTSLKDYNYQTLADWFYLQEKLDPKSSFMPYLAAYYFGGVQDPDLYRPILGYLKQVGTKPYGENWRWLVHAVYMARYKMKDLDKALELAKVLGETEYDDAPSWVERMPAYVMTARGDKEAAYTLMLEILRSRADKLHPNEVNAMRGYMCTKTLSEEDAAKNPLCENLQ